MANGALVLEPLSPAPTAFRAPGGDSASPIGKALADNVGVHSGAAPTAAGSESGVFSTDLSVAVVEITPGSPMTVFDAAGDACPGIAARLKADAVIVGVVGSDCCGCGEDAEGGVDAGGLAVGREVPAAGVVFSLFSGADSGGRG